MKIFNKITYIILLGSISLIGCKKEFLDVKPIGLATEVSFFSTIDGVSDEVTASYAQLYPYELMDVYYGIDYGDAGSDDVEVGGSGTQDQPEVQNIDRMLHNAALTRPAAFYGYMYKGIRMANTALYYIPKIKGDSSAAVLSRLKGEALFLRAFYHFCLAQVYGGVVVVTDYVKDYTKTSRSTLKETYSAIESDLRAAIPLLQERSDMGAANIGRATKSGAKAYLVKLLVYESSYAKNYPGDDRFAGMLERWGEAATLGESIVTSGVYSLVGSNGEKFPSWWGSPNGTTQAGPFGNVNAFRWLFSVDGDNSTESIFEVQNVLDKGLYALTLGNYLTRYTTVKKVYGSAHEKGWGWNCPTVYLVSAFGNKDDRESNLHSTKGNPLDDPRFLTTIGRDSDSIYWSDDADKLKNMKWRKMHTIDSPTGMLGRKFECAPWEYFDVKVADGNSPYNIRLFRYADLLLLTAEAAFQSGDKTTALNYVNQIRTRARLAGSTGAPANLTDISYEDIIHERRLELALEGHRFFDLMRWNLGPTMITGISIGLALNYNFTVSFTSDKNEFFPIPITQIQLTGGSILKQNPGY